MGTGTSGRVSDAHEVGVAASGTTTDPKTMVKYAREPANSTKSAKVRTAHDLRERRAFFARGRVSQGAELPVPQPSSSLVASALMVRGEGSTPPQRTLSRLPRSLTETLSLFRLTCSSPRVLRSSGKKNVGQVHGLARSLQEHQGERHGHQEDGTAAGQAVPRGRPGAQALHRLPQVLRWSRKDRPGQERGIHQRAGKMAKEVCRGHPLLVEERRGQRRDQGPRYRFPLRVPHSGQPGPEGKEEDLQGPR